MEAANIFGSQSHTNIGLRSNAGLPQKLFAEAIGAYVIIFAWCGSVAMYKLQDDESITFGGINMTWGAVVMVMVYSMAQVSGAHFNPAVTLIFTVFRRSPWKLAPVYIIAQLIGSILAGVTLALLLDLIAEVIGTYFIIFAGCGSVAVNKLYDGSITFPGICVTWGLIVMVMIYSLGHVSGAHFNPAVTITFTIFCRFSWKLAPFYIIAQLTGSILASGTLTLLLDVTSKSYFGTIPIGFNAQSLAIEIIISFLLMFVVCGVCTDDRAIGHLGGLAIGMTIILNVFVAGPISGASMNPARSIGPARDFGYI